MPLVPVRPGDSLDALLEQAGFVMLHAPESPETIGMIGPAQLAKMKNGTYLINNNTRRDPAQAPRRAALDVFPAESGENGPGFSTNLNPWADALGALSRYLLFSAVNFPEVDPPAITAD